MHDKQEIPGLTKGNRVWLAIFGILEIFFGLVAIITPYFVGESFIYILGIILICWGVVRFFQGFTENGNGVWDFISAAIFAGVGIFFVSAPQIAMGIITLAVGWALTIAGGFKCGGWLYTRHLPGAGWRLFNAGITIILGLLVLFQWPVSSNWLIGTIVGIELLMTGWALVIFAFNPPRIEQN